jgi:hypothetical protein
LAVISVIPGLDRMDRFEVAVISIDWLVTNLNSELPPGVTQRVTVECEFACSPYASKGHRRKSDTYDSTGLQVENFDETAY